MRLGRRKQIIDSMKKLHFTPFMYVLLKTL